jgi:hypothetical protein
MASDKTSYELIYLNLLEAGCSQQVFGRFYGVEGCISLAMLLPSLPNHERQIITSWRSIYEIKLVVSFLLKIDLAHLG